MGFPREDAKRKEKEKKGRGERSGREEDGDDVTHYSVTIPSPTAVISKPTVGCFQRLRFNRGAYSILACPTRLQELKLLGA